jgi:hypothetical protein
MYKVSLFEGFNKVVAQVDLVEVLNWIREGVYQKEIEMIQGAVVRGEKKRVDRLKKQLPAVTFSAQFEGGRKAEFLKAYHQIIVLDLDKVEVEKLNRKVRQDEHAMACFCSPSGQGLKILVRIDSEQELHEYAFKQVATYYERLLKVDIDRSGKDVTRLCFLSWDESCYYNPEASIFKVEIQEQEIARGVDLVEKRIEEVLSYTQQKSSYHNGNRNNFVYQFAANCNREGLPSDEVLNYCMANLDLSINELKSTIKSAYRHHREEFGIEQGSVPQQKEIISLEESLRQAPYFPESLYHSLPDFLRKHCTIFKSRREKDVFLSSVLSILSGCMNNVSGLYHGRETHANLYSMILAPAASGKSVMNYARMLGEAYERKLKEQYQSEKKNYQKAMKTGGNQADLTKPKRALFYIPANSSSSRVVKHLQECGGSGIICETEADTLGNVLKQDWGGYSDILRKAYSGEPISQSRQTEDEYCSLTGVRLSVLMAGTPNQVFRLIPSAEDGLFSRFLFYTYAQAPKWQDVSPEGQQVNLDQHFRRGSEELLKMIQFWKEEESSFQLQKAQWKALNERFSVLLNQITALHPEGAASMVKRCGNALYRIAMILTVCRYYEQRRHPKELICNEADFQTALALVEVYLAHGMMVLERLPKAISPQVGNLSNNKRLFLEALPNEFKRKDAIALGVQFGFSPSTVDRMLRELKGTLLKMVAYGVFGKV